MDFFQWWNLIPNFLAFFVVPVVTFYFFCLYCSSFAFCPCLLYTLLSSLFYLAEVNFHITGFFCLFPEILILFLCGLLLPGKNPPWSLTVATLISSVNRLCHGISHLLFFWLMTRLPPRASLIGLCLDSGEIIVQLALAVSLLQLIRLRFPLKISKANRMALFSLTIPVFYIALVERTIQDFIYGDTIVMNRDLGIISPIVNHLEILILQLFACACLFLILISWKKMQEIFHSEQTIHMLKQQTQIQETYMKETRLRYEQTRAFRHDIKNHLTVVAALLNAGQTDKAREYLSHLEQVSCGLSSPAQTGNEAVDALLNAKFSLAGQENIAIRCEVKIPDYAQIPGIDWCILLANAIDNAIKATCVLPPEKRTISICGKTQGNFYLLSMENSCSPSVSGPPCEGIGLSNIRAVMEKYQGTVQITANEGIFKLNLLLLLL